MDLDLVLPPPLPNLEGNEAASGIILTMGEFYGFKAPGRELVKKPGDEYFYHQRIVRQYMVYNDHLLLIHDAGVGKTRSAMGFLSEVIDGPLKGVYRKIFIVSPLSLHDEWKKTPEYSLLDKKVDIKLISYLDLSAMNPEKNPGSLFVIDEVHKMASEEVLFRASEIDFDSPETLINSGRVDSTIPTYAGVWNMTHNTPLSKILLLTGTPMRNSVEDFYPVINLLLPKNEQLWDTKNLPDDEEMKTLLSGRVSYVRAADEGIETVQELGEDMEYSICLSQFYQRVGVADLARISRPENGFVYPLPLSRDFPYGFMKLEIFNESGDSLDYAIIDLRREQVIASEENVVSLELQRNEEGMVIRFLNLPEGTHSAVLSAPSMLNNRMRVREITEIPIIESICTPYHSHLFVRNKAEVGSNPLLGQGPMVFNENLSVSSLSELVVEPATLMHISSLFYTVISIFLRTLPLESRESIPGVWREHIFDDVIEPGKNIFYYEFTNARGGIQDLARVLEMVGYERFENRERRESLEGMRKKPRFVINPSERDRAIFNHPDNWDGGYIHISLYSERGATGVNYLDVRHIHRIPHWTPSENTQSLFRGIRAKSHDNLRKYVPELKIRVYSHIASPHPALINFNNTWASEGILLEGETYSVPLTEFDNDPLNPAFEEMVAGAHPLSVARRFDESLSSLVVQPLWNHLQLSVHGFAFKNLPNPSVHPNMVLSNLKLPEKEGFPTELGVTFYSPVAYRYWKATEKDVEISRMRRIYKIAAMDCDLNRKRNVLPPSQDMTENCDYMECNYECLPEERGLEIIMDSVNPETGEDVRWERDDPWAPITLPRLATWEIYGRLSEYAREEYVQFLVQYFSTVFKGFSSIFTILDLTRRRFTGDREITENQALDVISDIVYGTLSRGRFRDMFDNPCSLKNQGNILYLCPLHDSERKLRILPRSAIMSHILHGPRLRLFTNHISWKTITGKPSSTDELKRTYTEFRDRTEAAGGDLLISAFDLAATNFELFVQIVEGAYLWKLLNGIPNPLSERFSKYFSQTEVRLSEINRVYIGGEGKKKGKPDSEFATPTFSGWSPEILAKNPRVYFHFLYHLHPSLSDVRKLLSERAPCKLMVEGFEDKGFVQGTATEQQILYEIQNRGLIDQVLAFAQRSETRGRPIGIFDEKSYIQKSDRDSMEYFKIYKYSEGAKKDPQGQVCTSITTAVFKDIGSSYGISQEGGKTDRCKKLYEAMSRERMIW